MTTNGKHLTEAEAWREVARLVDRWRHAIPRPWHIGLCIAKAYVGDMGESEGWDALMERMRVRVVRHRNGATGYEWPRDDEHAGVRVLAALLLAEEAAEDEAV